MFVSYIFAFLVVVILALASLSDIFSRRIPNYLSVFLVISGFMLYTLTSGVEGMLFSLKGMGLGFVILFIPYLFGGMGAGDVKLMAGVGAALGPWQALMALLFTSLLGGIFAIFIIVAGDNIKETFKNLFVSIWLILSGAGILPLKAGLEQKKKTKVPYGFVIACGTVASMIWRIFMQGKLPVGNL